jgi:hypothetical protein
VPGDYAVTMRNLVALCSLMLGPVLGLVLAPSALAQNSDKKIRAEPSPLAARAGTAVPWRTDLVAALAEAKETKRLVFWYVPTIERSFMDRKPEVDRGMMAGPFSWPRLITLLSERYIPVKLAAGRAECERYGLRPIEFIEPGFVVLAPDDDLPHGKELVRHDRLSTLHPAWFEAQLAPLVGAPADPVSTPWRGQVADGSAEARFALGAAEWQAKREGPARTAWEALCAEFPEHPLAWKAAMELEGHGPFVRGLESYRGLPGGALVASGQGSMCAAGVYSEPELWVNSLEYLLSMQRADGGFRDSIYDFGGTDGLPNVYVAVTSIAAIALMEGLARLDSGALGERAELGDLRARLAPALDAALAYALDDTKLNPEDSDELVWGHIYRLRAATRYLELRGDASGATDTTPVQLARIDLPRLAGTLVAQQKASGSWAHEYPNPFATASALVALGEANAVKPLAEVSDAVAKGTVALLACRTEQGAYTYGSVRPGRAARADIQGSVGRTPLGELALDHWAPASCIGLEKAIALSFEHQHHLEPTRKYDDHTNRFAYGGFFYWYDVHARVEAIARLGDAPAERAAARAAFVAQQRALILAQPEIDGTFIDSHEIGKAYGTALALWCLAELR